MKKQQNSRDNFLPAIVVVAFNRPYALRRILSNLSQANYKDNKDITLIISIDNSDCKSVAQVAQEFNWNFGTKLVIEHPKRLGLRKHIITCGDLTEKYGSIILLEDDLLVSSEFYNYTVQALSFYSDQPEISGISLYSYDFNEYAELRFIPLDDGFDNYFIQTASSWGQSWTFAQWNSFKEWYKPQRELDNRELCLPPKLSEWPQSSWKKCFIQYMVSHNKYFVYPRISLSTNSGDAGTNQQGGGNFQVPLIVRHKKFKFSRLTESISIYDSHYEIKSGCLKRLVHHLQELDFECDFYGTKPLDEINANYLISIKKCKKPIHSYGFALVPMESNIIYELDGTDFSLGQTSDFSNVESKKLIKQFKNLHKNLGWKRYLHILLDTIFMSFSKEINFK